MEQSLERQVGRELNAVIIGVPIRCIVVGIFGLRPFQGEPQPRERHIHPVHIVILHMRRMAKSGSTVEP